MQQLMNSMLTVKRSAAVRKPDTCLLQPAELVFTGVDSYCIQLWLFDSSCSLFSRKTNSGSAAFSGMFYFFPSYRRLVSSLNTEGLSRVPGLVVPACSSSTVDSETRITASSRLALAVH